MKRLSKLFTILSAVIAVTVSLLCVACDGEKPTGTVNPPVTLEFVDYAGQLKLDFDSNTKKQEVTMRLHVDGDTTHFDPVLGSQLATNPSSDFDRTEGYIKARYIAINTPESTGKIEEWGDAASKFTRSKVESAESIIVESDDNKWNYDGNNRHILWVWYKPKGESDYRNLNVEILQEGLAFGSSVSNNRYGKTAFDALTQARKLKKYVHSGEKDPDYPYGEATKISLKELRTNVADYVNKRVKVEGVVTSNIGNCVYIEDVDAESGQRFAIQVFYGYEGGMLLEILAIGNRVSIVGIVKYYEAGDTYQISDVTYNWFHPDEPTNTQLIKEGTQADVPFTEIDPRALLESKVTVTWEEETEDADGNVHTEIKEKELAYGEAIMNTSVIMNNLEIVDRYITKKGTSMGAMSLTCKAADGTTIVVRTEVLYDKDGKKINIGKDEDGKEIVVDSGIFPVGSIITVKGLVDKYEGQYQVKVYRDDYIIIQG